jgi:hypothetical protein
MDLVEGKKGAHFGVSRLMVRRSIPITIFIAALSPLYMPLVLSNTYRMGRTNESSYEIIVLGFQYSRVWISR